MHKMSLNNGYGYGLRIEIMCKSFKYYRFWLPGKILQLKEWKLILKNSIISNVQSLAYSLKCFSKKYFHMLNNTKLFGIFMNFILNVKSTCNENQVLSKTADQAPTNRDLAQQNEKELPWERGGFRLIAAWGGPLNKLQGYLIN